MKKNIKISMNRSRFKRLKQIILIVVGMAIIHSEINTDTEMLSLSKHWEGHIQQELHDFGKKMDKLTSNVSVSCDHFVANYSCTIYYDKNNKNPISIDMEIKILSNMFEQKFQELLLEIKIKSGKTIARKNLVVYTMPTRKLKRHRMESNASIESQRNI